MDFGEGKRPVVVAADVLPNFPQIGEFVSSGKKDSRRTQTLARSWVGGGTMELH